MKLEYAGHIERLAESDGGEYLEPCPICRVACPTARRLKRR